MAWLQPDNVTLLQELCAHCAHVAACCHGIDLYKSWALCASFPSISLLACTCTHSPGMHRPIANVRINNVYLSSLTAEYPFRLAKQLATLKAPFCSSLGHKRVALSHFSNLLPEPVVHRRPLVCDGAGMNSSADASNPSTAPSPLQDVITRWLQFAGQHNLTQSIVSHLCQARDAHPLTEAQQLEVAAIAHSCLPSAMQRSGLLEDHSRTAIPLKAVASLCVARQGSRSQVARLPLRRGASRHSARHPFQFSMAASSNTAIR